MFAVATLIIEQASGEGYADFTRKQIFAPLGMNRSRIDGGSELRPDDNRSSVYIAQQDGSLPEIPVLVWKNDAGAGGIYSSAADMARWAGMQLDGGRPLLSSAAPQDMWSPVTPIDISPEPDL